MRGRLGPSNCGQQLQSTPAACRNPNVCDDIDICVTDLSSTILMCLCRFVFRSLLVYWYWAGGGVEGGPPGGALFPISTRNSAIKVCTMRTRLITTAIRTLVLEIPQSIVLPRSIGAAVALQPDVTDVARDG
ncbi:unnamed protein product, partial [Brenthis ino]